MFDASPNNLHREIRVAERVRELYREAADQLVFATAGKGFRSDWAREGKPASSNHGYEFLTLMLGRMTFDNPAGAVTSRRTGFEQIAYGLEDALNHWIVEHDPQDIFENVVEDSFFFMGVVETHLEEDTEADYTPDGHRPLVPKISQINYWRYFVDPLSCAGIPPRFKGHVCYADKDDLLKDPEFDHEAVKKLAVDVELELVHKAYQGTAQDSPTRNQIVYYEVWVPDAEHGEDPSLYHGKIYTIGVVPGKDDSSSFIRKSRPFFGPATGPYVEFGAWPIPGSPYKLAPLAATKEQAEELNAHEAAISKSALTMKDVYIFNASQGAAANALKDAKPNSIHKIQGFVPGQSEKVSFPGPSQSQIDYRQQCQDKLDRVSGINDAMRGNLDPNVTATANSLAAQSSAIRVDTMVKFAISSTRQVLENVCWYMFNSEFFTHRLSEKASQKMGLPTGGLYSGGNPDRSPGLKFRDIAIEVEPYSMERVDPVLMQGRVLQVSQYMLSTLPARVQFPFFNWQLHDDQIARAFNFKWAREIIDEQMLAQTMQAMAQAQQQEQPKPLVPYKDAPGTIKAQMEAKDGYQPSQFWLMQPDFDPNQPKQSGRGEQGGMASRMRGKFGGKQTQSNGRAA